MTSLIVTVAIIFVLIPTWLCIEAVLMSNTCVTVEAKQIARRYIILTGLATVAGYMITITTIILVRTILT